MPAKDMKKSYRLALSLMGLRLILQPEGLGTVVGVQLAGDASDGLAVKLDTGNIISVTFSRLATITIPDLVLPPVPAPAPVPQVVMGVSASDASPSPQQVGTGADTQQVEDAQAVLVKLGMKQAEAREAVFTALRAGCKAITQDIVTWVYRHR
jgi:hypothetical protein